jgi:hypothetical protein
MIDLKDVAKVAVQPEALTFELLKAGGEKILTLKASSETVRR